MKYSIGNFVTLGERLSSFGSEDISRGVIEAALTENSWFTHCDVLSAIECLRAQMLDEEKLREWLCCYAELPVAQPRNVLVVMAGNIPAVGFFDMLCVLASGHRLYIKPSSKDMVLILFLRELLLEIEPEIPIYIYKEGGSIDAVIATGGESANLYFRTKYRGVPALLRGNRSSVAVLDGSESAGDIELLARDIYSYSGLGCRNVSMVFIPKGYELRLPRVELSQGYRNNYMQQRALAAMRGEAFVDSGASVLCYSKRLPAALSTISIYEYSAMSEVEQWLLEHDKQLQCVVSRCCEHPRAVGFGQSQSPTLLDYPDAVDVMKFLML